METHADRLQVEENANAYRERDAYRKNLVLQLIRLAGESDKRTIINKLKELELETEEGFEDRNIEQVQRGIQEFAAYLSTQGEVNVESTATPSAKKSAEPGGENPILVKYRSQYDTLSAELKDRCSWEELASRLSARENHYLQLAQGLQDGGRLVHIDKEGNPVFKDGGVEPVMKGENYNAAREALYGQEYQEGTPHYGYEMINSTDELRAIEASTGEPFVASDNRNEWRATWMESGKNPSAARVAGFGPGGGDVGICGGGGPSREYHNLGVVRLLRVKKVMA